MAAHITSLFLAFVIYILICSSSYGHQFCVGGRDGWVLNPSESYSHWAERLRFQVNDTLLFKYKTGQDSVLEVSQEDFDKCNMNNPKMKMEDGNSTFKFVRSGAFFFISGNKENCEKGQKLIIVVMAVRTPPHVPQPPTSSVPAPSPHPVDKSPVEAPAPAVTVSPSPSPTVPAESPGNISPAPASTPAGAPAPHRSFATPAFTPSVVVVSTVSVALSVAFGGVFVSY